MKTVCALVGALLCAGSLAAGVDPKDAATNAAASGAVSSTEPQAQARLVSEFSGFAGSDANARSLVAGLRHGGEITLTASAARGQPGPAIRFVPPTRPMDYGNIRIALALAREQLAQLGIGRPTPAQIRTVLAGGGIASHTNGRAATPFLVPGVLQMRAGGMGWAKIAGTMGVTLNQAMSGKTHQAGAPAAQGSTRPGAAGVAGGVIPVAAARTDVPAPHRVGAAPGPISSASITTSVQRPATPTGAKVAAPARPPAGEPAAKKRDSRASEAAAADNPTKRAQVPAPVQAAGIRTVAAPLESSDGHIGPEDSQATE